MRGSGHLELGLRWPVRFWGLGWGGSWKGRVQSALELRYLGLLPGRSQIPSGWCTEAGGEGRMCLNKPGQRASAPMEDQEHALSLSARPSPGEIALYIHAGHLGLIETSTPRFSATRPRALSPHYILARVRSSSFPSSSRSFLSLFPAPSSPKERKTERARQQAGPCPGETVTRSINDSEAARSPGERERGSLTALPVLP